MLILNERSVDFVLEYAPNKIIAALEKDLLLIEDWEMKRRIVDPRPGNTSKLWIAPLPDFDVESFPFMTACGDNSLNMINI